MKDALGFLFSIVIVGILLSVITDGPSKVANRIHETYICLVKGCL